jgi:hypothetical protein
MYSDTLSLRHNPSDFCFLPVFLAHCIRNGHCLIWKKVVFPEEMMVDEIIFKIVIYIKVMQH